MRLRRQGATRRRARRFSPGSGSRWSGSSWSSPTFGVHRREPQAGDGALRPLLRAHVRHLGDPAHPRDRPRRRALALAA